MTEFYDHLINYTVLVVFLILAFGFVLLVLSGAFSADDDNEKLTLEDIRLWDETSEPNDEVKSQVNEWIGRHPDATRGEFEKAVNEILVVSRYSNAKHLLTKAY